MTDRLEEFRALIEDMHRADVPDDIIHRLEELVEAPAVTKGRTVSDTRPDCSSFPVTVSDCVEGDGAEIVRGLRAGTPWRDGPLGQQRDRLAADELMRRAADYIEAMGGVPAGWKLVPVEPTPEMLGAATDCIWDFCPDYAPLDKDPRGKRPGSAENIAKDAYSAMLAASPTPPTEKDKA